MINCPNCNHQNPDGALQCEACYTPLPSLATCPNCNAAVQADASFCGQCGSDLRGETLSPSSGSSSQGAGGEPVVSASKPTQPDLMAAPMSIESPNAEAPDSALKPQNFLNPNENSDHENIGEDLPDLVSPDPLITPAPIGGEAPSAESELAAELKPEPLGEPAPAAEPEVSEAKFITEPEAAVEAAEPAIANEPAVSVPEPVAPAAHTPIPINKSPATQLQVRSVRLRQVQTATTIELPRGLSILRIGKPNDHTPPDIDVSGFPDSEIVSRVHANIRVEGDAYYLEDVGSSNGTYINGLPLPVGNRHRLRPGDRIALGKGDKVSFIFESAS